MAGPQTLLRGRSFLIRFHGLNREKQGKDEEETLFGVIECVPISIVPCHFSAHCPAFTYQHLLSPSCQAPPTLCHTSGLTCHLHLSLSNRTDGRWCVDTPAPCSLSLSYLSQGCGTKPQLMTCSLTHLLSAVFSSIPLLHSPAYAA